MQFLRKFDAIYGNNAGHKQSGQNGHVCNGGKTNANCCILIESFVPFLTVAWWILVQFANKGLNWLRELSYTLYKSGKLNFYFFSDEQSDQFPVSNSKHSTIHSAIS